MNLLFDIQPDDLADDIVRLVPLTLNDRERLFAAASDPLVWEQHPNRDRYKREVYDSFFDEAIESKGAFLILDAVTEDVIGTSRYYDIDTENRSVAIGWTFLIRRCWGGIYNRSLKSLMIDHAFKFADRIIFHIGDLNIRSQMGTAKTGAKLDPELTAAEQRENTLVYVLRSSEWSERRGYWAN